MSISKHSTLYQIQRVENIRTVKNEDMPVRDIADNFDMKLPSVSHHLNALKQSDLVTFQRKGQELIYSLNLSVFEEVMKYLIKLTNRYNKPTLGF